MATYDLAYPGAAIDAILNTSYFLQEAGYIFQGSASEYSGTPSKRVWLIAPAGFTGYGISSPVPQGSIGICLYNGTAWVGKIINVATIDSTPTQNSGNAVSSGGAYAAINQLSASVTEALENLTFTDTTPTSFLGDYIKMKVSTTDGGVERILTFFTILAATTEKAGLMSAEDKAKVDSFLTGIRSMQFVDATTSAEQSIKLVEQLKWTVGGVQEVIDSITILAATSSKAGLLSASDKAYIDALPAALTILSNSISAALALMESLVGYYTCDTAAATAAKTVTATGYSLTNGGCIRIKMTNANTADNVTLNINSTGAKALYYDGVQASSSNSWEAGEVLEVYYDGTQYQCASGGGGTAERTKYDNTESGLSAENVQGAIDDIVRTLENVPQRLVKEGIDTDLDITDGNGYVLARFAGGHFQTKNFDSKDVQIQNSRNTQDADLDVADENGYVLMRLYDGHIKTKNFDSKNLETITSSEVLAMLDAARVKVVNHNLNKKLLNFAFITDTHSDGLYEPTYRESRPNLLAFKRLCNERYVDFGAHGGDLYTDYLLTREEGIDCMDAVTGILGEVMPPMFFAKGNHDCNGKCFPKADMDNLDWSNTYYVAYATGDVIGLKTVTQSTWDGVSQLYTSNVAMQSEMISNTQFYMLTENGIDVVHDPDNPYAGYFYKDFEDLGIRVIVINAYDNPQLQQGTGNQNYDGIGISTAQVNWFKNVAIHTDKSVVVLGHPAGNLISPISSHFNDVSGYGGDFVAYIHGHGHTDTSSTSGYLDIQVTRGFGTDPDVDYYAFSVFSVDIENGKLYETRIGSGSDREFSF